MPVYNAVFRLAWPTLFFNNSKQEICVGAYVECLYHQEFRWAWALTKCLYKISIFSFTFVITESRFAAFKAAKMIKLKSLILAQIERWRHA